jgi:hypothetical protein
VAKTARGQANAKVLGLLYSLVAAEIELDGRIPQPRLRTFAEAKAILKKEAASFLGEEWKLSPQLGALALQEFAKTGITEGAALTPQVRSNYVVFLRQLSSGFDLAAGIPQWTNPPPSAQ